MIQHVCVRTLKIYIVFEPRSGVRCSVCIDLEPGKYGASVLTLSVSSQGTYTLTHQPRAPKHTSRFQCLYQKISQATILAATFYCYLHLALFISIFTKNLKSYLSSKYDETILDIS